MKFGYNWASGSGEKLFKLLMACLKRVKVNPGHHLKNLVLLEYLMLHCKSQGH